MKFRVFCDVASCSHVEVDDVSEVRTASITRAIIALMMEAVRISETSVNFKVTTRRYIPEHSKLQYVLPSTLYYLKLSEVTQFCINCFSATHITTTHANSSCPCAQALRHDLLESGA
jgi:hypothetical protein